MPIINSGQSLGTLFIKNYIDNIGNKYKYNLICTLLNQLDNLGLILDKLKLIRIVERIFIFILIGKIYLLPFLKIKNLIIKIYLILKNLIIKIYLILKKNKLIFISLKYLKNVLKKALRRYNKIQ